MEKVYISRKKYEALLGELKNLKDTKAQLSQEIGESDDIVSLSPASASFDLYKNFEERGRHFKSIVRGLSE